VSGLLDIVSGASPEGTTNVSGKPVQAITGASVADHRKQADLKIAHRMGDLTIGASGAWSTEEDYFSRAFGLDLRYDLNQKNTTLAAGFARIERHRGQLRRSGAARAARDARVPLRRDADPVDAPRRCRARSPTRGGKAGTTIRTATRSRSIRRKRGWHPCSSATSVPDHRDSWSWLNRYRRHFPDADGTLHFDYRFYTDDWGVRSQHVRGGLAAASSWASGGRCVRRCATTRRRPRSSIRRSCPWCRPMSSRATSGLAAFGGLSPSLKAIVHFDNGVTLEATAGYSQEAANLRLGGSGSEAFATLRAAYGLLTVIRTF